ncbi:MAG: tetratricopeptide repeat protein [bacterium]|nr:tetratricopeptide repeat protein [bacterium]
MGRASSEPIATDAQGLIRFGKGSVRPRVKGGPRGAPPVARESRYGRWRALALTSVYLLFGLHIAHWRLNGTTLAPLELNEVMYTLEAGIVTAGFLLMISMMLLTVVFGRFFCSWACHILALEDLCSWILRKLRIRPKPVRSRVLALVPSIAMLYMFVWPQLLRMNEGRPAPELRLLTDDEGWASFVTSDFWRNLPDPWIAGLTFLVCGFAIVYFLGGRTFCAYGCPYGAAFSMADRFAPGRIKLTGACEQCGICTAVCTSGVRVHEELALYGKVVDAACMKDLDCVGSCPQQAISFGFSRPALMQSYEKTGRRSLRPDFSTGEELLVAGIFLATLVVFRGLYAALPFLMTLGLGGILGWVGVLTWRLLRRRNARLVQFRLNENGKLTTAGRVFLVATAVFTLFFAHSAYIKYHEVRGQRAFDSVNATLHEGGGFPLEQAQLATSHLTTAVRHGLLRPAVRDEQLATLHRGLGQVEANEGRMQEAVRHFRHVVELDPGLAEGHYNLAVILAMLNRSEEAIVEYRAALELDPDDADVHNNLGFLLAQGGDLDTAATHFRRAIELQPNLAHAYFNLGRVHQSRGEMEQALPLLREAARLDPAYARVLSDR